MDKINSERRSENMRRIKSKNTKPELQVRKLVYNLGYRYRLHSKKLPGNPDIVFPRRKKTIFVHGCFWHQHNDRSCKYSHIPQSKQQYWLPKLEKNKQRDHLNQKYLEELGWDFLIIWECQIDDSDSLIASIHTFLQ